MLTPREIVAALDRYIVGQDKAKRCVAIALRNRWRRNQLDAELREEISPKNILMIGPTGVGKTEIARRLAKLANAPFIKVEATKFTEVGYVGRDVEGIIRDLVESAIREVKKEKTESVLERAKVGVEDRILDAFVPLPEEEKDMNPLNLLFALQKKTQEADASASLLQDVLKKREECRKKLQALELEEEMIEIEVEDSTPKMFEVFAGNSMEDIGVNMGDLLGGILPKKTRTRRLSVADTRPILLAEESGKLLDMDGIIQEAINRTEQDGIVFLDEIDKIAGKEGGHGVDVSREGVQRDILPIVEGSTVMTKHGPVKTDHILFIAAGAFHISKPKDLIPELQGRFPIRVELESLNQADFQRILTEPKNALVKQYKALLETEGTRLCFEDSGIREIASVAELVNRTSENIGARRLQTILERLLEDVSFCAEEITEEIRIDEKYVRRKLANVATEQDLTKFVL